MRSARWEGKTPSATSGSVSYSKATGGDLSGTPLGACLLAVFYKMGFAAPASSGATFEITLRIPPR